MSEQQDVRTGDIAGFDAAMPVPAARPLSDFCMERVGDEVVMFDAGRDRYHTLNEVAFAIWRACDGFADCRQIAYELRDWSLDVVAVEASIAQLGESGLLKASEEQFDSSLSRRRMVKLVAAGAVGAVGIPVVASITRLGPEASASHPGCVPFNGFCTTNDDCCSHNCNIPPGNPGNAKCKN